jgi:hypothetical protein
MAKLKSLRVKDKNFIFTSFGNDKEKRPARVVFARFPLIGESFVKVQQGGLLDDVDILKKEDRDKAAQKLVDRFIENMNNGITDHNRFIAECVDHFEDFEYGKSKIATPDDFFQILPSEAAYTIADELFKYAAERDSFTMGE